MKYEIKGIGLLSMSCYSTASTEKGEVEVRFTTQAGEHYAVKTSIDGAAKIFRDVEQAATQAMTKHAKGKQS